MTGATETAPLLDVVHLRVDFGDFTAVDDVSLSVGVGERVAIVGESGSGKSVTAMSIAQLVQYQGGTIGGASRLLLRGEDLTRMSHERLRQVRGREIGVVFQDHASALNPVIRIGDQISEALLLHGVVDTKKAARARSIELLAQVGIDRPHERVDAYPHQLSGGMRQRALIASALAPSPSLLIADEPTTALDAIVQRQIVTLLRQLSEELGLALLMISHDLRLVAGLADRVYVMRSGNVVESGPTQQIFQAPSHPYTKLLLEASPSIDEGMASRRAELEDDAEASEIMLQVDALRLTYPELGVKGADDVSFSLRRGRTLGIVGESGSGKTTVARCVMRLIEPDSGRIVLGGEDIAAMSWRQMRKRRHRIQMIFQDPRSSLDPRMRIEDILAEPLRIYRRWGSAGNDRARLVELLELVGLQESDLKKYPREFSGGQIQRVAIARTLALSPDLLV